MAVACFTPFSCASAQSAEPLGTVEILMYHNVLPNNQTSAAFAVLESQLRGDFEYIKNNGYNVISCKELKECAFSGTKLPNKAVILTFDDGYLYNKTIALPLMKEYGYIGTFGIVGDFMKFGKREEGVCPTFTYFDKEDINECYNDSNCEIANHSYSLHYLNSRRGAKIKRGENTEAYMKMFEDDTKKMDRLFSECGATTDIYAYPYGLYCDESEQVLKQIGYKISFSCDKGVNVIYNEDDLYCLKRYDRSGVGKGASQLLRT